tara:strand:+ start:64 stop:267 length:204 start_codon:yes stop_codon:yes gene_type:complete
MRRSKRYNFIPFPYVVMDDEKKVLFYLPNPYPSCLALSSIMKEKFPEGYRGVVVRDADAFNKYGGKV